jgi:hypothetical protein
MSTESAKIEEINRIRIMNEQLQAQRARQNEIDHYRLQEQQRELAAARQRAQCEEQNYFMMMKMMALSGYYN